MICSKCKNDLKRPLVLSRGMLACPLCKNILVESEAKLNITKENEELFRLSEAAFYRGIKEENVTFLDRAIELCKEACNMHSARAYLKMGYYYDKNLTGERLAKKYRVMIAYEYYFAVCNNEIANHGMEHEVNVAELKKQAANQLLEMLSDFPEGSRINRRYSIQGTYAALSKKGIVDIKLPQVEGADRLAKDAVGILSRDLNDMLRKETNALFCVYRLKRSDLLTMFADGRDAELQQAVNSKILVKYYINGGKQTGHALSNEDQYEEFKRVVQEKSEREFILIIFNEACKMHFFKHRQMRSIKKIFYEKIATIDHIIDALKLENVFVFYEDDVFYCADKGKVREKIRSDFSDYIIGGDIKS